MAAKKKTAAKKWKSIASEGGGYVVMTRSLVAQWNEAGDDIDNARAETAPHTAKLMELDGRQVLALGTPDPLYFDPEAAGGILVRVIRSAAGGDAALEEQVSRIPAKAWKPLPGKMEVSEPLVAFDGSLDGAAVRARSSLVCDVKPGTYKLAHATYAPDAGTQLLLVRLTRG